VSDPLSAAELLVGLGVPALLWGAGMLVIGVAARAQGKKSLEVWRTVIDQLGLSETAAAASMFGKTFLEAREGRRRVRIERFRVGKRSWFTRVVVEGTSGISLEREDGRSLLTTPLGELGGAAEPEVELGDEAFDDAVYVRGPEDRVRARLDAETRRIVLRMMDGWLAIPGRRAVKATGGAKMVDGNLEATIVERDGGPTEEELLAFVDALLSIAARFHGPVDTAARLAANFEGEPRWRVRLRSLELLAASYPETSGTREVLRRALGDAAPEVRLRAALALGEEGTETLVALAGEPVEDAVSALAVEVLGDQLPMGVALTALQQSLRARRLATARVCIEVLARVGGEAATAQLAKVLAVETGPLAVAAANALAKSRATGVEDELIAALRRDVPGLPLAAVTALGRLGSVAAVPPIEEAATARGAGADLRNAARQAIAEIQSRLPGASPGQLSIVGGEAGQLSLATDDELRGRVSLPEAERGG
jgi:hypothetical protein